MDGETFAVGAIIIIPLLITACTTYFIYTYLSQQRPTTSSRPPPQTPPTTTPTNTPNGRTTTPVCPICQDPLRHPVETVPCGHAFCAECLLQYWGTTTAQRILCPVDRVSVEHIIPSYTLREVLGGSGNEESSRLDARLREYNARTWHRGDGYTPRAVWNALQRHMTVRFWLRLRLSLLVVGAVIYIVSPFDLLPEGTMGVIGLVDDFCMLLMIPLLLMWIWR
eukprot:PhF_6_TR19643/c0_g1_i1/m.28661/K15707/RNF170; RING finger protein 170